MESESNRLTHFPMRDLYLYTFQNIMIYWEKLREGWRHHAVWSITTMAWRSGGGEPYRNIGNGWDWLQRFLRDRSSGWFLLSWEPQENKLIYTNEFLLIDKTLALLRCNFVRLSMVVCVSKPFIRLRWNFGVSCPRLGRFLKVERWMKGQGVDWEGRGSCVSFNTSNSVIDKYSLVYFIRCLWRFLVPVYVEGGVRGDMERDRESLMSQKM